MAEPRVEVQLILQRVPIRLYEDYSGLNKKCVLRCAELATSELRVWKSQQARRPSMSLELCARHAEELMP